MNRRLTIDFRDGKNMARIVVQAQRRLRSLWGGEILVPIRKIASVEERLPIRVSAPTNRNNRAKKDYRGAQNTGMHARSITSLAQSVTKKFPKIDTRKSALSLALTL